MTEADCGDITLFIEFDDRTYGTKEILMLVLDTPKLYGSFCQDLKVFRMVLTKVIGNAKAIHNKCLTASSMVFSTMDETKASSSSSGMFRRITNPRDNKWLIHVLASDVRTSGHSTGLASSLALSHRITSSPMR